MREGGKGGKNTVSGKIFEDLHKNLPDFLHQNHKYIQQGNKIYFRKGKTVLNDKVIANLYYQQNIWKEFLEPRGIFAKDIVSVRYKPDLAIEVVDKKFIAIIEAKSQKTSGSTDIKIAACDYLQQQWRKIIPKDYSFKLIYLLGGEYEDKTGQVKSFWKQDNYNDLLQYVSKTDNCDYCFDKIPNELLDGLE